MDTSSLLQAAECVLREKFGYPAFRPGQDRIITSVLSGRDTLAVLPTGGGKSICYQVPALLLPNLTIVVSPLISLMQDQVAALERRGLPASMVNSTLPQKEIDARLSATARGEFKMLYVAPERFDHGATADRLRQAGVSLLAVDEAHCISEWGHDFRPSYSRLGELRKQLGAPPVIALTATATPRVQRDIMDSLRLVSPTVVVTGFDRTNLDYHVVRTRTAAEKDTWLARLAHECAGVVVVYAPTRRSVERLTVNLRRAGIAAGAYHAGLPEQTRQQVQNSFMSGGLRIIVATNAFGMGIDKPDVRLVLHHGMPGTLEAYYQEAGRAGRDNKSSSCVLLYTKGDRLPHEFFLAARLPTPDVMRSVVAEIVHNADASGRLPVDWANSREAQKLGLPAPHVEAALALLMQRGAVAPVPPSPNLVRVRLLATPERIKRLLLPSSPSLELELLRVLWRITRGSIEDGATIDLANMPPALGDIRVTQSLLLALQSQQVITVDATNGGFQLSADATSDKILGRINWPIIERRRKGELAKLDAMEQYALTTGCRRSFVLRYFGDQAANAGCDGCDNCGALPSIGISTRKPRSALGVLFRRLSRR